MLQSCMLQIARTWLLENETEIYSGKKRKYFTVLVNPQLWSRFESKNIRNQVHLFNEINTPQSYLTLNILEA